jgi:hypothetical protein
VLVRETIDRKAGDLVDTTQTNEYVMDRSTIENVSDDGGYSFEPASIVEPVTGAEVKVASAETVGAALSLVVGIGVARRRGRTSPSRPPAGSPARSRPATARRGTRTIPGTSSA